MEVAAAPVSGASGGSGGEGGAPPAVTASSLRMAKWMRDYAALMRWVEMLQIPAARLLACSAPFCLDG